MRGDSGTSDDISIHAPPRGATFFILSRIPSLTISIHAPPRGATFNRLGVFLGSHISIHAPPRGATNPSNGSHQGRRISIHAPPRGATADWRARVPPEQISIHAPPRGATAGSRQNAPGWTHFNSRPSARGDTATLPNAQDVSSFQFTPLREGRPMHDPREYPVSIFQFTPLREGRLPSLAIIPLSILYFNSRPSARGDLWQTIRRFRRTISIHAPPRGATTAWREIVSDATPFQFTPLREGRRGSPSARAGSPYFNSRPSARGDRHVDFVLQAALRISIHAPPRGATRAALPVACVVPISIHAPPRGATSFFRGRFRPFAFQFTPLREGRRIRAKRSPQAAYFNSRPSARGDQQIKRITIFQHYFNSRPSARGDSKRYAISANLLFNPYKSAWLNNNATQFVEIILVIFHRIIA